MATRSAVRSVTCLGVGDGVGDAVRRRAAFLYRLRGRRILVDCGEPVTQSLLQAGVGLEELDHVFISHLHFDHMGGLPTLLQSLWLSRRRRPLTVHLPRAGIQPLRALMRTALLFDAWERFPLHLEALRLGKAVRVGQVTVTPFRSSHMEGFCDSRTPVPSRLTEAFSFRIEGGGCRVAHSADLGGLGDLLPLLAEPLDLLVCELAHLAPEALFEALAGRPIRQLALVHLSGLQWRRRGHWLARASRALAPTRVTIPGDGEVLRV